jgi:hypothetical protein
MFLGLRKTADMAKKMRSKLVKLVEGVVLNGF